MMTCQFQNFRIAKYDDVVVPVPTAVIDFPALSILDVEGIPFTKVQMESTKSWEEFGECLQNAYGPTAYTEGYIADGVGLARCMEAKNPDTTDMYALGAALYQCGLEHPEYLTDFANSIRPPTGHWLSADDIISLFGIDPNTVYVGQVFTTPYGYYTITGPGTWYDNLLFSYTFTYTVTWWESVGSGLWGWCRVCMCYIREEEILTGYLSEPIVMDKMRGVTLTCIFKNPPVSSQWITYSYLAYLWYEPTFDAAMSPPAFRGGYYAYPPAGQEASVPITGCFGGGYYYPGIYDGKFQFQAFYNSYNGTPFANFRIKNLAKVTGEGTVVPPGY